MSHYSSAELAYMLCAFCMAFVALTQSKINLVILVNQLGTHTLFDYALCKAVFAGTEGADVSKLQR